MMEMWHAGLGWPTAATLVLISFVASFMTIAFGVGGGAIMLAALATLLPAAAIIPVHGLVQLGSNAGRAAIMTRYMRVDLLWPFAIGSVIGIALGGSLVVQLNAGWVQICVGSFILWSALAKPPAFLRRSGMVTGAFSSFLTMFFGGTGPFVATYTRAQDLERHVHVGTQAMLMTLQHLLKTIAFGILGFAFSIWAGLIALLIAAGVLGTLAGKVMLSRLNDSRFHKGLKILLTLLALRLIYAGVSEVFFGDASAEPMIGLN